MFIRSNVQSFRQGLFQEAVDGNTFPEKWKAPKIGDTVSTHGKGTGIGDPHKTQRRRFESMILMDFDQAVEEAEDDFSAESAPRQATTSDVAVVPKPNDVLLGRGKGNERHPGNIRLKEHIAIHLPRFSAQPRGRKKHIINEVVQWVNTNGRFVTQKTKKCGSAVWVEASGSDAFQKIAQAFRYRQRSAKPVDSSVLTQRRKQARASKSKAERLSKKISKPQGPVSPPFIPPDSVFQATPMSSSMSYPISRAQGNLLATMQLDQRLQELQSDGFGGHHSSVPSISPPRAVRFKMATETTRTTGDDAKLSSDEDDILSLGYLSPLEGDMLLSDFEILSAIGELPNLT